MTSRLLRPLVGLMSIVLVVCAFVVAANLFRGGYADTASVTVISERAGLVMNPDAKFKFVASKWAGWRPSKRCRTAKPPFIWQWTARG